MSNLKILFSILLCFLSHHTYAQDLGLKNYDLKNYTAAIQYWSDASSHPLDVVRYYNLGCAHYKNGSPGLSLAHFAKALTLGAKHDDLMRRIKSNFDLTQHYVISHGLVPQNKSLWPYKFRLYAFSVKPEWLYILGSIFVIISILLLVSNKTGLPTAATLSLLGFLNLAVAGIMDFSQQIPYAYVSTDSAPVRSGPGEQFTELWHLPAGTLVQVKSKKSENWQQINTDGKGVGWVVENNLIRL